MNSYNLWTLAQSWSLSVYGPDDCILANHRLPLHCVAVLYKRALAVFLTALVSSFLESSVLQKNSNRGMTSANHAIRFELSYTIANKHDKYLRLQLLKSDLKKSKSARFMVLYWGKARKKQLRPWVTDPLKTWKVHSWSAITKEMLRNVTLSIYEIDSWITCSYLWQHHPKLWHVCSRWRHQVDKLGSVFDSEISAIPRFKAATMNHLRNETFKFDLFVVAYCIENTE